MTVKQRADAGVSLSDSAYRRNSIGKGMQESLYQTADNQKIYQTVDAGVSLLESGCRKHSIRQRSQESQYQIAEAGDTLLDS